MAENIFDEWQTGKHVTRDFKQKDYEARFEAHRDGLKSFHERTARFGALATIQKELLRKAREHAGAAKDEQNPHKPILDDDALAASEREWAARAQAGGAEQDDDELGSR